MFSVNLQENSLNISVRNTNILIKLDWQSRQIIDFSFSQKQETVKESPLSVIPAVIPEETKEEVSSLREELRKTKEELSKYTKIRGAKVDQAEEKLLEYITENQPCKISVSTHMDSTKIKEYTGIRDCSVLHAAIGNLIDKNKVKRVKNGFFYNYCLPDFSVKDTYIEKREKIINYIKENSPCIISRSHDDWQRFKAAVVGREDTILKIIGELLDEGAIVREKDGTKNSFYIYSLPKEKIEEPEDEDDIIKKNWKSQTKRS